MKIFTSQYTCGNSTACRGGASEASGATFTDHVAGARDITRAPVCMYVSYIRASSP